MKKNGHKIIFSILGLALLSLASQNVGAKEYKEHIKPAHTLSGKDQGSSGQERDYSPKSLNDLIEELLTYNPELKSLVADINAAKDYIPQASALDDPRLSFEASQIPTGNPSLSRTPMTGLQLYLRQKIPFPGKLRLKKKIAKTMAEQTEQQYLEKLNQLVAKFKMAYYEYAYINQAIAITEKTKRRLQALANILEDKYAAGKIPQQDVLRTKVELSKIKDRLIKQRNYRETLIARVNSLLLRPTGTPLRISEPQRKITPLTDSLKGYLELAKNNRPWLHKIDSKVKEAKYNHTLAKTDLLPDFDFSAGYRFRNDGLNEPIRGEDFFSTGVSINIPIWSFKKQGKKISETRHRLYSTTQNKEAIEQEVIYQVEQLYHEINQLKDQYSLFSTQIIPEAKAAVSSSRTSYEAGEVDYLNVITNELGLFNDQLTSVQYYYEHEKKIAELEMAIGHPVQSSFARR